MFNTVISEANKKLINEYRLKLSKILEMMGRSWRLILGAVLLSIFVSFVLTLILPKKWEASATLQIAKLPSEAGDITSVEDSLQSVEHVNQIGFKEKTLNDLQLPTNKGQDQRSDILLDTLIARPIKNTKLINISVSAYSQQDALKSIQAAIAELQATQAPMITPSKNRLNKELQIINQNLSMTDKDISALNHQMSRGGYSVSGYIKAKEAAKRALQLQQDQLNGNLLLIDELATKPIYPINNPDKQSFPNRIFFLILGALLGLLAGCGTVLWKDRN
jgi:LPS O-antigen subunit length determinant protein (WzzB/FepE family)